MPGREPPRRGHVRLASPGFGHDLHAGEEAELDADAREADAAPPDLGARAEIVIAAQLPATHAPAVVHDIEPGRAGVAGQADFGRSGIEGIRDDLGQDSFLERTRVCVAQVLEEVEQVNAGFAHGKLPAKLTPAGGRELDFRACSRRASAGDELRAAQGRGRQAAAGPRGLRRTTRVSSVLTCSGRRTAKRTVWDTSSAVRARPGRSPLDRRATGVVSSWRS